MLKNTWLILVATIALLGCDGQEGEYPIHKLKLENKTVDSGVLNGASFYTTYLPVYTSVFALSKDNVKLLTSTVSIHNMNLEDSLYIRKIDYYNTQGEFVRSYVEQPIFVTPMETINIVIHQADNAGGTGANFLVDWALLDSTANPPLIEAVMISTAGQQGISFTTRGVVLSGISD